MKFWRGSIPDPASCQKNTPGLLPGRGSWYSIEFAEKRLLLIQFFRFLVFLGVGVYRFSLIFRGLLIFVGMFLLFGTIWVRQWVFRLRERQASRLSPGFVLLRYPLFLQYLFWILNTARFFQ